MAFLETINFIKQPPKSSKEFTIARDMINWHFAWIGLCWGLWSKSHLSLRWWMFFFVFLSGMVNVNATNVLWYIKSIITFCNTKKVSIFYLINNEVMTSHKQSWIYESWFLFLKNMSYILKYGGFFPWKYVLCSWIDEIRIFTKAIKL